MSNFSWEDVITHIDELVMDAVESSTADLATVIKLHDKLLEISEITENSEYPGISQISQKTADFAMSIVLQEAKDPEKTLDFVIEATSCLQCMVREILRGGSPLYIPIPEGLGLNSETLFAKQQSNIVLQPVKEASKATNGTLTSPSKLAETDVPATPSNIPIPQEPVKIVHYPEFEMGSLTPSHLADFLNELYELIQKAESLLLDLDKSEVQDIQNIQELFGVFHTIKGISGIIKLQKIIELSHKAEILLEKVAVISPDALHTLFECIDVFKGYGKSIQHFQETKGFLEVPVTQDLVTKLESMRIQIESTGKTATTTAKFAKVSEPKEHSIKVETKPANKPIELHQELVSETDHLQITLPGIQNIDEKVPSSILPLEELDTIVEEKLNSEPAITGNKPSSIEVDKAFTEKAPIKTTVSTDAYGIDSIKITIQRLDMLMDSVGELVIAQSMIENDSEIAMLRKPETVRNFATIRKITRELQKLSMSMRMVTMQPTFQAMERLVRDLAHNQNKGVEVVVTGEHTELDRNIIDAMYNPLIHLVRNAVGHGIESSQIRKEKGKNPKGRISFNAYHRGGNIVIEIKDDGQGLQRDKILKKAIQQGIIEDGQSCSDDDIYQLIFMPGFTTADKIDEISGRGVGLDVVKKSVEKLRGRIEILTNIGQGTTFRLTLPLTLAIIEGMLVRLDNKRYIIPLIHIEEFVQISPNQLSNVMQKGQVLLLRGNTLPVFDLERILQGNISESTKSVGVIVSHENKRYCFLVDELIGQQQVVIKSLGSDFQNLVGISGAAILGDGRVGLILDVQDIVHRGLVKMVG